MRARSVLALAILVGLLAAYIAFVDRGQPSTDERRADAGKILDLDSSALTRIRIEQGGTHLVLERSPGSPAAWRLTDPVEARADESRVTALLDTLRALESERSLDAAAVEDTADSEGRVAFEDRALREPRARLVLSAGNDTSNLRFGPDVPGTDSLLLGADGDGARLPGVHQVDRATIDALGSADGDWVAGWRDKRLFHASRQDIHGITLMAAGATVVLRREEGFEDRWRIDSPVRDRANDDRVASLLTAIVESRAVGFPPVATAHADEPFALGRIEAALSSREAPYVIELGSRAVDAGSDGEDGGAEAPRRARVDGRVVEVGGPLASLLDAVPDTWRDPRWTRLQVFAIAQARFADREGIATLVREDADWTLDGEGVDFTLASDLLYAVANLRSDRFLPAESLGAFATGEDAVALDVTLRDERGAAERLTLRALEDGRRVAMADDRETALVVEPDDVETLLERLRVLRSRVSRESGSAPATETDS